MTHYKTDGTLKKYAVRYNGGNDNPSYYALLRKALVKMDEVFCDKNIALEIFDSVIRVVKEDFLEDKAIIWK